MSDRPQDTVSDTAVDEGKSADFSPADQGKQFAGKTWIALGDSITEKNFRANLSYYDYVIDDLGCEVVNYGKSGTGYKEAVRSNRSTSVFRRWTCPTPIV